MLSKLFKPKWQHKSPEIRLQALQSLQGNAPEDHTIIATLASHDSDPGVRQQAICRLDDLALVETLTGQEAVRAAALRRYGELLANPPASIDLATVASHLHRCPTEVVHYVASHCREEKILSEAVLLIESQQALCDIALSTHSNRIRRLIAELLVEPELIRQVLNHVINKDKATTQLLRDKLNQQKSLEKQAHEKQKELNELLDNLEQHARLPYNGTYEARFHLLGQHWQKIAADATAEQGQRYESARERCQLVIRTQASLIEGQQAAAASAASHLNAQLGLCEALERCLERVQQGDTDAIVCGQLSQTLQQSEDQWQALATTAPPHPREKLRFERSRNLLSHYLQSCSVMVQNHSRLRELLDAPTATHYQELTQTLDRCRTLLDRIDWPNSIPPNPELTALQQQHQQLGQQLKQLKLEETRLQQEIRRHLDVARRHLDEGQSEKSGHSLIKARELLGKLPGNLSRTLETDFRHLQKRKDELLDWQHFATDPKREALCQQMEKLIDLAIPPEAKAKAIRQLQQDWKELGDARNTRHLWQRFKKAADTAYLPCKEHFAQEAALRRHNLEQRQHLCSQLEDFIRSTPWPQADNSPMDNPKVDWPGIERICQQALAEWLTFSPVERSQQEEIQRRFDQSLHLLRDRLKAERKANAERKQALIDRARALVDSPDINAAIQSAKQLQQEWQSIGITQHKESQRLWSAFRQACDHIFERRSQEKEQAREEQEANLRRARLLIDDINALALAEGDALQQNQAKVQHLVEQFHQLGSLPRNDASPIRKAFQQAQDQFQERVKGMHLRQRQQHMRWLREASDSLDASLCHVRAEPWQIPAALLPAWTQALERKRQASPATDNDKLRQLCIELEVLTGTDTPAEDQNLRMEYQMRRLSDAFGQRAGAKSIDQIEGLIERWCSNPILPGEEYETLKQRFFRTVDAAFGDVQTRE